MERFLRAFEEARVWLHNLEALAYEPREVVTWIHRYNPLPPHPSLGPR